MNAPEKTSWIRSLFLLEIVGCFILAGASPAPAATYTYKTPLNFKWTRASGSVDHYNVHLSVDGQPFKRIDEVGKLSCKVDVQDGRTYVLKVQAEDGVGRVGPMSAPSDQIVVRLTGSKSDTDGDGMKNTWEASYGLNPFDPNDAEGDPDGDGLANIDEFKAKTDPTDPDTDGDGIRDGDDPDPLLAKNKRHVADAGEDQELDPTVVILDGSGSYDPDRGLLSYSWIQQAGPEVELSDARNVSPSFLGTKKGKYRFKLVVREGKVASQPDEVVITIRNVRPAADAGQDREVYAGTAMVLDGSGSADPNGDPLRFKWTQTAGARVNLEGAKSQAASFVPELAGVYTFRLVTFDGRLFSPPDEVQVIVDSPTNHVPTADAGRDRTAKAGEAVTLNGSGSSDRDRDPLSYAWSQVEGPEPVVLEGPATVEPWFRAHEVGLYRFRLIVNDDELASAPDSVTVIVESARNRAPVADVADVDPVREGEWVALDGSASYDPDHDPLTYSWLQTKGPQVMLEKGYEAVAGFYTVTEGTLAFELQVDDGEVASIPASVEVQVIPGDPGQVQTPPRHRTESGDSGGCSVGAGGDAQYKVEVTDIGYVLTLLLPAFGAVLYQKRRLRRRKKGDATLS